MTNTKKIEILGMNFKLTPIKNKINYYDYLQYKKQLESSLKDLRCRSNQIKNKDRGFND